MQPSHIHKRGIHVANGFINDMTRVCKIVLYSKQIKKYNHINNLSCWLNIIFLGMGNWALQCF